MTAQTKDTCATRVAAAWESTREDLAFYMKWGTDAEDIDGHNSTDPKIPEVMARFEDIGDFHDYALSWDYVIPETFEDQPEGYWRFQISYGGPTTEIRFYATPGERGFVMHRAEFWFLDWFDGAQVNIATRPEAQWLWDWFEEVSSVDAALKEATA